jgi:hypothetical protein
VLVQDLSERVPHLLGVGIKIEHVPHHVAQPVIGKFLQMKKKIYNTE